MRSYLVAMRRNCLSLPMVRSTRFLSLYLMGSKALSRGMQVRCGMMGWTMPGSPPVLVCAASARAFALFALYQARWRTRCISTSAAERIAAFWSITNTGLINARSSRLLIGIGY